MVGKDHVGLRQTYSADEIQQILCLSKSGTYDSVGNSWIKIGFNSAFNSLSKEDYYLNNTAEELYCSSAVFSISLSIATQPLHLYRERVCQSVQSGGVLFYIVHLGYL